MGVGVGGGQLVGVATLCGCCHASACCSGGKGSRGLSGGLARSQSFWLTVAGFTRFPPPWLLYSFAADVPPRHISNRLPSSCL